jgi:hypothetical protein
VTLSLLSTWHKCCHDDPAGHISSTTLDRDGYTACLLPSGKHPVRRSYPQRRIGMMIFVLYVGLARITVFDPKHWTVFKNQANALARRPVATAGAVLTPIGGDCRDSSPCGTEASVTRIVSAAHSRPQGANALRFQPTSIKSIFRLCRVYQRILMHRAAWMYCSNCARHKPRRDW